jgi:hypothetical protein
MKASLRVVAVGFAGSAIVLAASALAQGKPDYETAPTLAAAQLVPPALAKGAGYEIADPIRIERFLAAAELRSQSGTFKVSGTDMLALRVSELRAIDELRKVEGSSAFGEALAKSAAAPVKLVGSLVTEPGRTVENIASGAGTVLGRIGYSVKSGAKKASDAMTRSPQEKDSKAAKDASAPPAFTDDPLGYNRARREWAKKLDIDPYTSNPVLRPLLDDAARATFAGNFAVGMTVGAVAAPLQYATDFEGTVKDTVWDKPPGDLAKSNEEKLARMGVPGETARAFLRNRWYTPTLQTALVGALDRLNGVAGRDAVVRAATSVAGEVPARFLIRSVTLLANRHREAPLAQVRMRGIVPIGVAKDGSLAAAVAVDYLYWSEEAATFARAQDVAAARRVLLVQGQASSRAASEFARAGWTLRAGLRPGA